MKELIQEHVWPRWEYWT